MGDRYAPGKTWRDYTACSPKNADLFFLDVGESPRRALELCGICVVKEECLEYALTARPVITRGVWGGKTERQLRNLRQARLRAQQEREADQARRDGLLGCFCGAPDTPYPTSKYQQRHRLGIMGTPPSEPCEQATLCRRLYAVKHGPKWRETARAKRKGQQQ